MRKKVKIIIGLLIILVLIVVVGFLTKDWWAGADADLTAPAGCGNFKCEKNESSASCPQDCDSVSDLKSISAKTEFLASTASLPLNRPLEKESWDLSCQSAGTAAVCPTDTKSTSQTIDGKNPLTLKGSKANETQYISPIYTAEPNTNYEITANLKITNRHIYNYLDFQYPGSWHMKDRDTLDRLKGIWGGQYSIGVYNNFVANQPLLTFTQPKNGEVPYRNASETDWFIEEKTINSGSSGTIQFVVDLKGFDGNLNIDSLIVKKLDSVIPESALHIPIESWNSSDSAHEPAFDIQSTSELPFSVTTNTTQFSFTNDALTATKGRENVADITFASHFLDGLKMSRSPNEQGIVIVENKNVIFSIGADSTVLTKCRVDCKINLSSQIAANSKNYHYFEDGIIFATDYNKGIFFTPIKTDSEIYLSQEDTNQSSAPKPLSTDNWQIDNWFNKTTWKINYSFKAGAGFLAESFPPKDLNMSKYCNEMVALARNKDNTKVNLNLKTGLDPKDDYQSALQAEKNGAGAGVTPAIILWMNGYAITKNDLNPPDNYTYYLGSDNLQYFKDTKGNFWPTPPQGVSIQPTQKQTALDWKVDASGPYIVQQKAALEKFTRQAHAKGLKVVLYMSPFYYYTSNIDRFLANMKTILAGDDPTTTVDGVYFDGLYYLQSLKSLELVRRTRNYLKDKMYIQHLSRTYSVIRISTRLRVPVFDAYADELLTGETIYYTDDNEWKLNYCGKNVSNTISNVLGYARPPQSYGDQTNQALSNDCKIFVPNPGLLSPAGKSFMPGFKEKCSK